jgi:hypothetical protein
LSDLRDGLRRTIGIYLGHYRICHPNHYHTFHIESSLREMSVGHAQTFCFVCL